ncbi:MAG: ABC transporter ATP-binding protein [Candidatus Saliniplasma sp.]
MDNALEVKNVYKRFDGFTLSNISFDIAEGEILLVGGKNGAGKTKLLETISCISPPSEGYISYFDKTVYNGKIDKENLRSTNQRFGVQIQDERLLGSLTIKEIIETFSSLYEVEDYRSFYSDCSHIKKELDQRVGTLSDGKKQLVKFLLSIGHDPDIVFLDEPTSYLDGEVRNWVLKKIGDMRSTGTSFIITLNQFWDIGKIADRLMILEEGSISNIIPNFKKYYHSSVIKIDKRIDLEDLKSRSRYLSLKTHKESTRIITEYDIKYVLDKIDIDEDDILKISRPKLEDFYPLRNGREKV